MARFRRVRDEIRYWLKDFIETETAKDSLKPTGEPFKILFICTGNSARFRSHSAGANPVGRVNPYALFPPRPYRGQDIGVLGKRKFLV